MTARESTLQLKTCGVVEVYMLAVLRARELGLRWCRLVSGCLERAARWAAYDIADWLALRYAISDRLERDEDEVWSD